MNQEPLKERNNQQNHLGRIIVVISVLLIVAIVHILRVGSYLEGMLFNLYYSYFSDIIVPVGIYFLLCLNEIGFPFLKPWWAKAGIVFAVASVSEILQGFGVPLLGQTFDPLDIVMFAIGVMLAVFLDRVIFTRLFPFWSTKPIISDISD